VSVGSSLILVLAGGGLASGAWTAYATVRERGDRAARESANLVGAKRSVAAEWIAYVAFMESCLARDVVVSRLEPPTDAWPRHADEIAVSLSQDDWSTVVVASLIVDGNRRHVDALTQLPLSKLSGGRTKAAVAAFSDADLETIRRGIAVLDPDTWRGVARVLANDDD
jgi:hypothetical protein